MSNSSVLREMGTCFMAADKIQVTGAACVSTERREERGERRKERGGRREEEGEKRKERGGEREEGRLMHNKNKVDKEKENKTKMKKERKGQ